MLCLHLLADLLQKYFHPKLPQTKPCTRLRLEKLEERLTPDFSGVAVTYTNAITQITPNWASLSVAETVTATVTTIPFYNAITGQTTPVPAGAGTPVGAVVINLNNQQQTATLDANGHATATFHLPLVAVLASQQLTAIYQGTPHEGAPGGFPGFYAGSTFETPLYMNSLNLFLPATLTFGQLTPQQLNGTFTYINYTQQTSLPSFNSAQGEMDNLGWFAFHYIDPGIIDSVILPGFFAFEMGAYNGFFPSSLSNASSS